MLHELADFVHPVTTATSTVAAVTVGTVTVTMMTSTSSVRTSLFHPGASEHACKVWHIVVQVVLIFAFRSIFREHSAHKGRAVSRLSDLEERMFMI